MQTSILADTFTGTAGVAIAGTTPSTPNGTDQWSSTLAEGAMVYSAGGGATSSGSAPNYSVDISLTGRPGGIGTYATTVQNSNAADTPTIYLRADAAGFGQELVGFTFDYNANVVGMLVLSGGVLVTNVTAAHRFAAGAVYAVQIILEATAVTVFVDGVAVFNAAAIPASTASRLYLRQQGPHAGAVTFGPLSISAPAAAPTSATFTGPTTGPIGSPSTAFTVTLNQPAPSGGTVVAFAGGTGGTFAGVGISGSALTIAPGQTVGTFTYTKSAAGSVTITPSSSGIAFNPTNRSYAASANSPSATSFTVTGPTAGYVRNVSDNFSVTPDGNTTGTFTPTPVTGATFNPSTLTWAGDASTKTFTISGMAPGTVSINGTFSNGLATPPGLNYTFNAPSLAVTPPTIRPSTTTTLTFVGAGTKWLSSAPSFGVTGVNGVSIGSVTIVSDTKATAQVTASSSTGTVRYTDSTTSATATQALTLGGQLSVYYPLPSLSTVYFIVSNPTKQTWNGKTFEITGSSGWRSYAIAATDVDGTGFYVGDFPAGIAPGTYSIYGYRRVGSSPASADTLIGTELDVSWNGVKLTQGSVGPGTGLTASGTTLSQATSSTLWGATDRLIGVNSFSDRVRAYLSLPRQGQAQQFWDGFEQLATAYFGGTPIDANDALARVTDYATALTAQLQVAGEIVELVAANAGTLQTSINATGTESTTVRTFP